MKPLTFVAPLKPGSRRIAIRRLMPVPTASIPDWNPRVSNWMSR